MISDLHNEPVTLSSYKPFIHLGQEEQDRVKRLAYEYSQTVVLGYTYMQEDALSVS